MGKLIAIDGLDGSGKKTQSDILCHRIGERGIRVRELSFPVYESESSALARLYLSGGLGGKPDDTNAYAASMFFAADRYVTYRLDWHADAEDPETVIVANRYTTANAIHQLTKLPREMWDEFLLWLYDFEYKKLGLPEPDIVIFLEVPPEVTLSLIKTRSDETGISRDIHESDAAYIKACHAAAVYAADRLGWHTIKCCRTNIDGQPVMRSRDEIAADVERAIAGRHIISGFGL